MKNKILLLIFCTYGLYANDMKVALKQMVQAKENVVIEYIKCEKNKKRDCSEFHQYSTIFEKTSDAPMLFQSDFRVANIPYNMVLKPIFKKRAKINFQDFVYYKFNGVKYSFSSNGKVDSYDYIDKKYFGNDSDYIAVKKKKKKNIFYFKNSNFSDFLKNYMNKSRFSITKIMKQDAFIMKKFKEFKVKIYRNPYKILSEEDTIKFTNNRIIISNKGEERVFMIDSRSKQTNEFSVVLHYNSMKFKLKIGGIRDGNLVFYMRDMNSNKMSGNLSFSLIK